MSVAEAEAYHAPQVRAFRGAGADLVTAMTINYAEEGAGIARAAADAEMPVVISITVETDGRLATGQPLGEAIAAIDAASGSAPAYYMVNCAHPTHFAPVLAEGGAWVDRFGGLRPNASTKSHAELDAATELDDGEPRDLGARTAALRRRHPRLTVFGGCCGTDHRHVGEICLACAAVD
jgi:homocysteine S-methyltransferase